jgi:glucarate dehydratase
VQITRVEGIRVAVPIEAPILTCYGALQVYTRTVIKVHTSDGLVGIGETHGSVTPERLAVLGKAIAGLAPWEVGRIRARLNNLNYYSKDEQAVAGIEVACLDLLGRVTGRPVYDLLGGKLRDEIEAAAYMFFRNANEDGGGEIKNADAMASAVADWNTRYGFTTVKIKGGVLRPEEEIDALRLSAGVVGPEAKLRIDPQGGWSLTTALNAGRALEQLPMEYLEDPVWGMQAMATLRRQVRIPFATNMCVTQFDHLGPAVDVRPVDVILTDIWYWGGMQATLALDTIAGPLGFGLGMHANCELGIGLAAMLHMSAVMPNLKAAIDVMHIHALDDIVVGGPVKPTNGVYRVPDGPGLGVEIDDDKLQRYAELAKHPSSSDRLTNPTRPDPSRPGWFATLPAW